MRLKNFKLEVGAQVFSACSDSSRLRILHLILYHREMCISDLELILDFTQTKTSRHLAYLKNSGILGSRKFNQWVFYFVKDEMLDIIKPILAFTERDMQIVRDKEIFNTLFTNRELAYNKLTTRR